MVGALRRCCCIAFLALAVAVSRCPPEAQAAIEDQGRCSFFHPALGCVTARRASKKGEGSRRANDQDMASKDSRRRRRS